MPKLIACILLLIFFTSAALAQTAQVSGKIADTAEKKESRQQFHPSLTPIRFHPGYVIPGRMRPAISGCQKLPGGHYLLLVTYPAYADYVDTLDVDSGRNCQTAAYRVVLKSQLLQAVVVNGSKGGIRIKGDTAEFNADSFHVHAGATVEDLLKKLPGIQVDRNGQITAQGQTVKKVLVDGEEFFGDDPTLVTQNLRADMVDKVQVYDKKSDQATFTGIDDGVAGQNHQPEAEGQQKERLFRPRYRQRGNGWLL